MPKKNETFLWHSCNSSSAQKRHAAIPGQRGTFFICPAKRFFHGEAPREKISREIFFWEAFP